MLKFFTTKLHNTSLAINPQHVVCVQPHAEGHSWIYTDRHQWEVKDEYLEVIARLNERD